MPEYLYKAIQGNGQVIEGVLVADAEAAAVAELRAKALLPLRVSQKGESLAARLPFLAGGLSANDRVIFARQLTTLVRAGIPLDRSLGLCRDLAHKPALREVVEVVLKQLRSGKPLADSLAASGRFFPPLYVAMVRAGEASGTLSAVLERLVEFEEFNQELRTYLVSALIYPALLLTVGGAAVTLLLGWVVPRFAEVFEQAGRALPLPTWILLQVAEAFQTYALPGIVVLGVALWGVHRWTRTEAGRLRWDGWKLRAPVAGPVWQKLEIARFAKTLGTLLNQAVPIVSALRLTRDVLGNRVLAGTVEPLMQGVKRGQGLARPLAEARLFPPLAVQLTTLGEETGRLDAMLLQVAEVYDREVRTAMKRLVSLVEPAVILVMGLIVGAIVVSTLLAIVSINEVPF